MEIYIPVKCKHIKKSMPLTWDLLTHGTSEELKEIINEYRIIYSNKLKRYLDNLCEGVCVPQMVGTADNITYSSDIDINLTFSHNIQENLEQINKIFSSVNTFHEKFFKNNYSDLFDINIYGTTFDLKKCDKHNDDACLNDLVSLKNQRLWSFSRLVQVFREHGIVLTNLPEDYKEMSSFFEEYKDTLRMLESSHLSKLKVYIELLQKYYNAIKKSNFVRAATVFSLSKYFENETYRSVGAYLHIVVGRNDLAPVLYRDSAMDNLGFAIENLLKSNECVEVSFEWKMLRVAKYLDRIIHAIVLSNPSYRAILSNLHQMSQSLNSARKTNDASNLSMKIKDFMDALSNLNGVSKINIQVLKEPSGNTEEMKIIVLLLNFVIGMYW